MHIYLFIYCLKVKYVMETSFATFYHWPKGAVPAFDMVGNKRVWSGGSVRQKWITPSETLHHLNTDWNEMCFLWSQICPHRRCFSPSFFPVTTRNMDELQDVQLTEIKPLLTNKVSLETLPSVRVHDHKRSQALSDITRPIWQIRKLIRQERSSCSLDHQSELFMRSSVGGKRKEKERGSQNRLWPERGERSGVNNRGCEWKRLQSRNWMKSLPQTGENKSTKEEEDPLSSSSPLLLYGRLAGRCEATRVSLCSRRLSGTDGRAVWHLGGRGEGKEEWKRRLCVFARLHLWGRKWICRLRTELALTSHST